jgi:hypothetical protein
MLCLIWCASGCVSNVDVAGPDICSKVVGTIVSDFKGLLDVFKADRCKKRGEYFFACDGPAHILFSHEIFHNGNEGLIFFVGADGDAQSAVKAVSAEGADHDAVVF